MYRKIPFSYLDFQNGLKPGCVIDGRYRIVREVDKGSFGTVFEAHDLHNQLKVAIKITDFKKLIQQQPANIDRKRKLLEYIVNQPYNLKEVESPYIVKYYDNFQSNDENLKFLVMQFCEGPTLASYMKQLRIEKKVLSEDQILQIIRDVILGVRQLHRKKIVHRDLHICNIMKHGDRWKIFDLGLSKMVQNNFKTVSTDVGCIMTKAPEIIQKLRYGLNADVWSIGVVLYFMLTFKFLCTTDNSIPKYQIIENIKQKLRVQLGQIIDEESNLQKRQCSQEMKQLLRNILVIDPRKRFSINQILSYKIFKQMNIEQKDNNENGSTNFQAQTFEQQCQAIMQQQAPM